MKSFSQLMEEYMNKMGGFPSDESTEQDQRPIRELTPAKVESEPVSKDPIKEVDTAVAPKSKSSEEMNEDPKALINQDAVKDMGAKGESFDAKEWWDSVTKGTEEKISACMKAAESFADDPGKFCGSIAEKVGYRAK